jgi:hypothetical protein
MSINNKIRIPIKIRDGDLSVTRNGPSVNWRGQGSSTTGKLYLSKIYVCQFIELVLRYNRLLPKRDIIENFDSLIGKHKTFKSLKVLNESCRKVLMNNNPPINPQTSVEKLPDNFSGILAFDKLSLTPEFPDIYVKGVLLL